MNPEPITFASSWQALAHIARHNKKRLAATFTLVAAENILFISYPVFSAFAINAVVRGDVATALLYSLVVLVVWGTGALRRSVDTRVFARMYAELTVPVIVRERSKGTPTSTISARVRLSRELIDFFETHLPTLLTAAFSTLGAAIMLLALEPWAGVAAAAVLLAFALLLPRYTRINDALFERLNNRLEKEVRLIDAASAPRLGKHYHFSARLRILLSNREALGYLCIGVAMAVVVGVAVARMRQRGMDATHLRTVMTCLSPWPAAWATFCGWLRRSPSPRKLACGCRWGAPCRAWRSGSARGCDG